MHTCLYRQGLDLTREISWFKDNMMNKTHYVRIARAVNARRLESRNVARRKVIELTADIADILADDSREFRYDTFYTACGFTDEDIKIAQDRTSVL